MSDDDSGVMGNLPRSRPGTRSSKRGVSGGSAPRPATEVTAQSGTSTPGSTSSASAQEAGGGKSAAGRPVKKPAARRPAAGKTTAAGSRSTSPSSASRARTRAPQESPGASDGPVRREEATQGSTDPVTGAVILAGKVVETGLKVAGGIVKRLPRP